MMLFALDADSVSLINLATIAACGLGLAALCLLLLSWNRRLRRQLAATEASLTEARLAEAAAAKAAASARAPARPCQCPTCGAFIHEDRA